MNKSGSYSAIPDKGIPAFNVHNMASMILEGAWTYPFMSDDQSISDYENKYSTPKLKLQAFLWCCERNQAAIPQQ